MKFSKLLIFILVLTIFSYNAHSNAKKIKQKIKINFIIPAEKLSFSIDKNKTTPGKLNNTILDINLLSNSSNRGKAAGFRAMGAIGVLMLVLGIIGGFTALGLLLYYYVMLTVYGLTSSLVSSLSLGYTSASISSEDATNLQRIYYVSIIVGFVSAGLLVISIPLIIIGFTMANKFSKQYSFFMENDYLKHNTRLGMAIKIN